MAINNAQNVANHQMAIRMATERWFFGTAKSAVVFFRKSFTQKGWTGGNFEGWAMRKRKYDWPILRKSKDLYNSFTIDRGNNSYVITADVDYASYHNEGTERLPKRQFMGQSITLDRMLYDRLEQSLRKVLNK